MTLNPYLNYAGNCKEAFEYYAEHLGGKIQYIMMRTEMAGPPPPPEEKDFVLHGRIDIAGVIVQASDVPPSMQKWEPMRSAYLNIGVTSDEEAERIHLALSDGGKIFMPIQETFYAHKFSMLQDKFGINWMVIHERPMPS